MTSTKKAFLNAGAIVAIILAGICILGGIIVCASSNLVTEKAIKDVCMLDSKYTLFTQTEDPTLEEGDYYFTYTSDGKDYKLTKGEIETMAKTTSAVMDVIAWFTIAISVANIVISAFIMRDSAHNKDRKAFIITLLVLSVLMGNLISMAFMIVGLCMKNKPEVLIETTTQQ